MKTTGGGKNRSYVFSEIEETVIKITGLETSTEGIRGASSFGIRAPSPLLQSTSVTINNLLPSTSDEIIESVMEEICQSPLIPIERSSQIERNPPVGHESILTDNAPRVRYINKFITVKNFTKFKYSRLKEEIGQEQILQLSRY